MVRVEARVGNAGQHDEHSTRGKPDGYVYASKLDEVAQKMTADVYRWLARPRENSNNKKGKGVCGFGGVWVWVWVRV